MYHVLGDPPAGAPFPQLYVSRADFAGQMRWLARHGYTAVTLRSVWGHWHGRASLPPRPVVVSFDDGYRSVAQAALPVLRERGWPGVLNLAVKNLRVRGGISERQVRRLIAGGWEIDAHSLTHPDLTTLDDPPADARDRGLAAGAAKALRHPGRLLLLPGRQVRRARHRGRACGRIPRRYDDGRGPRKSSRALRAPARARQPRRRRLGLRNQRPRLRRLTPASSYRAVSRRLVGGLRADPKVGPWLSRARSPQAAHGVASFSSA